MASQTNIVADRGVFDVGLDNSPIGETTPEAGYFTTMRGTPQSYYGVSWDESADTYVRTGALSGIAAGSSPGDSLLPIQAAMRRCILNDDGIVQYYLEPDDSYNRLGHVPSITGTDDAGTASKVSDVGVFTLAESEYKGKYVHNTTDDTYALITAKDSDNVLSIDADIMDVAETFEICTAGLGIGGDGQVMVEIPAFYYRYAYSGTTHTWEISFTPLDEFSLHPAFINGSEFLAAIYVSAYEGSMYDASASAMVPDADIETAYTIAVGDLLCSLSGEYPKTNETRDEFRIIGTQRNLGWDQLDFNIASAIQLLYLVEYADFDSQSMISNGRTMFTTGSWEAANQGNGKYIGKCGYSNALGNASGGSSRASAVSIAAVNTETDTSYHDYMSYRGIENFLGNVSSYLDGINVNDHVPYVSNNNTDYQDDTDTNYLDLGITLPNTDNYQQTLHQQDRGFLPATVGADTSKITDYYYQAAGWRVVILGGVAHDAAESGVFLFYAPNSSTDVFGAIGGRLVFKPIVKNTKDYKQSVVMTNDTTWTGVIPPGYELEKIVFVESAGNAATLDLGTTSGGHDVFSQLVIAASKITTVTINKTFSMLARQTLYLNDDGLGTWNSASLTATLLMRRVI